MSSLDASDEMLRFMTTLIRTGMKDCNGVVNLPSNAIKRARENDQNRKWLGEKWRGNLDFIKNLYNHVRRTEKAVVNADTPQGRLDAINNSLLGSIIKIPGDNDKICFALKSSDTKEFAEYKVLYFEMINLSHSSSLIALLIPSARLLNSQTLVPVSRSIIPFFFNFSKRK